MQFDLLLRLTRFDAVRLPELEPCIRHCHKAKITLITY